MLLTLKKFALLPLGLAVALAFAGNALAQTLTAVKAAQAPKLEALAANPAWAKAAETKVDLKNGRNFNGGATTVRPGHRPTPAAGRTSQSDPPA